MDRIYDRNGLIFWSEKEINFREFCVNHIALAVKENLISQNRAFQFIRTEAPILTPTNLINPNYSQDDYFATSDDLVLRPETTMGSFEYAKFLLTHHLSKLPFVVWQHGKSFRNEQDKTLSNMRLKEFYQQEFQIMFSPETKNDYSLQLMPIVRDTISELIGQCSLEESDRLPSYSEKTIDVVFDSMEVCSMSLRNDFELAKVFEIAVGTDRLVYNKFHHCQVEGEMK